jgi:hypothetical protein
MGGTCSAAGGDDKRRMKYFLELLEERPHHKFWFLSQDSMNIDLENLRVLTGFNWLSFLAKWQALLNTELNNWIP